MKKQNKTIIIVICLVLLIGYLLMKKPKARTTGNGNGDEAWNGIPVYCCWCEGQGAGHEICNSFNLNSCPIDTVPDHAWETLECNK